MATALAVVFFIRNKKQIKTKQIMARLISIFTELLNNGSAVIQSNEVKSFHKAASAHGLKYEIGPKESGKTVLVTI